MGGSREGTGGPDPPPEKSQNIGFLSNTGPGPLKDYIATKPAFIVGVPSGSPAKRHLRFAGGPMMKNKTLSKFAPSGKIFWIRA